MINNVLLLVIHTALLTLVTLFTLRKSLVATKVYLALLAVGMNLFVLKQITLFGLDVTCSDTLAVGYLLGLNLIQEFFGRKEAIKTIGTTCFASLVFMGLSQLTLLYHPSSFDEGHTHFAVLLTPQLRIVTASIVTFLFVQWLDVKLFAKLRNKANGRFLALRTSLSLVLSQTLDTVMFSFLGLYTIVHSVFDIIIFSLIIKVVIVALSVPYVTFARRVIRAV